MEKNNGKIVAIVALAVAVVALSVGFAAFTDTLNISGNATATANGNAFDVADHGLNYKSNSAKCYLTSDANETALQGVTVGTLSDDSWSGISVPLGDSAKDITCEAVVENKSAYTAYLTSIASNGPLSCSSTGANATVNANAVCAATQVTVSVGTVATDKITFSSTAQTNSDLQCSIGANGEAKVKVRINYAGAIADQDVTITLPVITHDYSSVSNSGS